MEQQKTAPQEIRNVIDYLRSSKAGMKLRVGVLNGKRVDYFKGKAAIKALQQPAYAKLKAVPKITSESEAIELLSKTIQHAFYLRVERGGSSSGSGSPKHLQLSQMQQFKAEDYYAWFYEGSQWTTYLGGIAMVAVILAGVMFPLWPPIMRQGVWYLSLALFAFLGIFLGLGVVRLILYVITLVVASPGIWLFPNLYADCGFFESFVPVWEWDLPKKKSSKKRRSKEEGDGGEKSEKSEKKSSKASGSPAPSNGTPYKGASIEEVPDDD